MCQAQMNGKQYVMHGVSLLRNEKIVIHERDLQKPYRCQRLVTAFTITGNLFTTVVVVMEPIGLLLRIILLPLISCYLLRGILNLNIILDLTTIHLNVPQECQCVVL